MKARLNDLARSLSREAEVRLDFDEKLFALLFHKVINRSVDRDVGEELFFDRQVPQSFDCGFPTFTNEANANVG
jgi:hypothetical protein